MATVADRPSRSFWTRLTPVVGWKAFSLKHVWLLPILLAALALRVIGRQDAFLYGDEAEYAIVARYLSRDFDYLAYPALEGMVQPFVSQPPLQIYLMALSMKLLGPTDFAATLPSILFGTATVAAVYACGHRLGGRFMAFAAAILLAVLPFHIQMSRKAMLDAGYTFFLVVAAYFAIAWLQQRQRRHAVGVGLGVAGATLTKLPGILALPAVGIAFLVGLVVVLVRVSRKQAEPREVGRTFADGGIAAGIVAGGVLLYLALLMHLEAVRNLWVKLQWQLGRVDEDFASGSEAASASRDWTFYFTDPHLGFVKLFGGAVLVLAIVGLVVALLLFLRRPLLEPWHVVIPAFTLVLAWFFLYSDRKEGFYLLPFAPFFALLVAQSGDGLRRLLAWAGVRLAKASRQAAPVALVAGLLVVATPALSSAGESYEDYVLGDTQEKYFGYGTKEAAAYIAERHPDAGQYGTLLGRFTLHWYNEQPTYHWYVDHTWLEGKIQSGELRYVVYDEYLMLEFDESYMRDLIQRYNGQMVTHFKSGWGEVRVFELRP